MTSFRRLFIIANLLLFSISTEVLSQDEDVFQATDDWQEIREGQKVPSGLHYRMNLETGKKEAKLLSDEDPRQETGAVLSDANEPVEEAKPLSPEEIAKVRAKMKKMHFNRDVEHIKVLIANYDNSTTDDKIVILDELDYYLHQFDNANDFIFLEGLPKVVIPALGSENEDLIEGAAILIGSAAQSNAQVQDSAEKAGLLKSLLDLFETWSGKSDKLVGRLVFALSSLIRDNEKSLDTFFNKISGQEVFLRHLDHVASDVDGKKDSRLVVKILTFIADVLRSPESRQNVEISFDEKLCRHLMNGDLVQRDDLDHIEKFVYCLVSFEKLCRSEMSENGQLKLWLFKAKDIVRENQESESDFERTATHINELVTLLNLTKSEL